MSRRLLLGAVAVALGLLLMIGGALYETKGDEIPKEETIHTGNEGGYSIYGPISGISAGLAGREEFSGPIQEILRSRKAFKRTIPPAMANTDTKKQETEEGNSSTSDDLSNYDSLGDFKVTAYTAGYESTGKNPGDPYYGITATGAEVEEGVTAAADWDILPPGTIIHIETVGRRVIKDKGGGVKGQHIDLYEPELETAKAWGVQHLEVHVIEWGSM